MNVNELIQQGKVRVAVEECLDNDSEVMFLTGIELPDGREIATYQRQLFARYPGEPFEPYCPAGLAPWDRIEAIRKIAEDHQYAMVEGVLVDAFSASAVMIVFHAASPKNKIRLLIMPIEKMVNVCFKIIQ